MKERILELRNLGKTYNEIREELGCSKSTISYHCGEGQKTKNLNRSRKSRSENKLLTKCEGFKEKRKKIRYATNAFQNEAARRQSDDEKFSKSRTFNYKDVISKFGEDTICYLTGEPINLLTSTYEFDHIEPISKSGDCSIDNLGITTPQANRAKNNMTINEFLSLCEKVLTYNGYTVTKIN